MMKCKISINYGHFIRVSNGLLISINYANDVFCYSNVTIILNLFAQNVVKSTAQLNKTLYKHS